MRGGGGPSCAVCACSTGFSRISDAIPPKGGTTRRSGIRQPLDLFEERLLKLLLGIVCFHRPASQPLDSLPQINFIDEPPHRPIPISAVLDTSRPVSPCRTHSE